MSLVGFEWIVQVCIQHSFIGLFYAFESLFMFTGLFYMSLLRFEWIIQVCIQLSFIGLVYVFESLFMFTGLFYMSLLGFKLSQWMGQVCM